MKIELQPPAEAAGIRIGSTPAEAHVELSRFGSPEDFRRSGEEPASLAVHHSGGLSIVVYFDSDHRVNAVEVGRPDGDEHVVLYQDLDVFKTSAEDLIECLAQGHQVEVGEGGVRCHRSGSTSGVVAPIGPGRS